MNYEKIIEYGFSLIAISIAAWSAVIAHKANKRSKKNQEEVKLFSSPKPFLKALSPGYARAVNLSTGRCVGATLNRTRMKNFSIKNVGLGVAVNVKANICWKDHRIELNGPNLLGITEKECVATFYLPKDEHHHYPDEFKIEIQYESDSGYKRTTIWQFCVKDYDFTSKVYSTN